MIGRLNVFPFVVFLYFLTLHADQLHVVLGGYTIRFNNLVAFFLLGLLVVHHRKNFFSMDKCLAIPLVLIAISIILSLAFSPFKTRCLFYLLWYGFTVLNYVLLPYLLIQWGDPDQIFSLYFKSFVWVGMYALIQLCLSFTGIQDPFASQRLVGSIVRPNAFCFEPSFYALYMTPCVFFYNSQYLIGNEKKSLLAIIGINILYLISTSTTVVFAYAIFVLFILARISHKFSGNSNTLSSGPDSQHGKAMLLEHCPCHIESQSQLTEDRFPPKICEKCGLGRIHWSGILKFCAVFVFGLFALVSLFPLFTKAFFLKFFYQGFMGHHSFYERWIGIVNGWKMFWKHPLFGVGLGAYPNYLMDRYLHGDLSFKFLHPSFLGENPLKCFEATNFTIELLASLGLVGLFSFLGLFWGLWMKGKQVLQSNQSGFAFPLVLSLLVTLLVLQFNQGLFRTYIWVHFSIVFAYLHKHSPNYSILPTLRTQ